MELSSHKPESCQGHLCPAERPRFLLFPLLGIGTAAYCVLDSPLGPESARTCAVRCAALLSLTATAIHPFSSAVAPSLVESRVVFPLLLVVGCFLEPFLKANCSTGLLFPVVPASSLAVCLLGFASASHVASTLLLVFRFISRAGDELRLFPFRLFLHRVGRVRIQRSGPSSPLSPTRSHCSPLHGFS